jgi:hypothetical protein
MQDRPRRTGSRLANQPRVHDRNRRTSGGSNSSTYERYIALAREAATRGDTVEAENFYQHAEHHFRQMRERKQ